MERALHLIPRRIIRTNNYIDLSYYLNLGVSYLFSIRLHNINLFIYLVNKEKKYFFYTILTMNLFLVCNNTCNGDAYDCVIEVINIISFVCLLTRFAPFVLWATTTHVLTRHGFTWKKHDMKKHGSSHSIKINSRFILSVYSK